jgi:hypothetical protein
MKPSRKMSCPQGRLNNLGRFPEIFLASPRRCGIILKHGFFLWRQLLDKIDKTTIKE